VCFVDKVAIPNSWKAVDAYSNKLYVRRTKLVSGTLSHIYIYVEGTSMYNVNAAFRAPNWKHITTKMRVTYI